MNFGTARLEVVSPTRDDDVQQPCSKKNSLRVVASDLALGLSLATTGALERTHNSALGSSLINDAQPREHTQLDQRDPGYCPKLLAITVTLQPINSAGASVLAVGSEVAFTIVTQCVCSVSLSLSVCLCVCLS